MAVDRRKADVNWRVADEAGEILGVHHANLAVLMDIRDELQKLNRLLGCQSFVGIPSSLRDTNVRLGNVERRLKTISRKIPTRKPRKRT